MTDTLLAPQHRERDPVTPGAAHSVFAPVDAEPTDSPAVEEMGGFTFQRMQFSGAAPTASPQNRGTDAAEETTTGVIRDIQFPRITNPTTPATERFNALVEHRPRFRREDLTNEVVDYEIVYAGEELISVRFALGADTTGAAHPNGVACGVTVLMRAGELLQAGDVFTVASGWQDFVSKRAFEDIEAQLRDVGFTPIEADVRETAIDTRQWLITEDALILLFPAYSFGAPYIAGSVEAAIPWSELAAYLNENAPAPIAAAASANTRLQG